MGCRRLTQLLIAACLTAATQADGAKDADRIVGRLPGLTFDADFVQYTGYLKANERRVMRYWLIESEGNARADPLLLWLGGGPGSSSIGNIFTMNGPFHMNADGLTLFENVYGWTKVANMLYIESPTGVGWSYSTDSNDTIDDDEAADVNYWALVRFLERFPEYEQRAFFINSVSYGGVYMPTLALRILRGKRDGTWKGNLKGLTIGNPVTSEILQHNALVPYMYFHGLIGTDLFKELTSACCGSVCPVDCDYYQYMRTKWGRFSYISDGSYCGNLTYLVTEKLQWGTKNNAYNIYQDCYDDDVHEHLQQGLSIFGKFRDTARAINYKSTDPHDSFPCWAKKVRDMYLNQPYVQQQLKINRPWSYKNSKIYQQLYQRQYYELDEQYAELFAADDDFRMLVYVGDADLVCNFMGIDWFFENVTKINGIPKLQENRPWFYRGQIAGYAKKWKKLDLVTVKGGSHVVPVSRPGPMLQLLANFLSSRPYSTALEVDTRLRPLVPPFAAAAASFSVSPIVVCITLLPVLALLAR